MDILCCVDINYIMPLCVSLVSVFENNKEQNTTVHVIAKGYSQAAKDKVHEIASRYRQRITFYDMDEHVLDQLPDVHGYLTKATYIRLFIANILPYDIEKILYIDNDLVVNGSLDELWHTNIEEHPCAVVLDSYSFDISNYNRLQYPMSMGYFNAGVMLVNLKYWREHKIQEQALKFAEDYPNRVYHADQDIMNYLFRESKLLLPLKYNAICTYFFKEPQVPFEYWEELREAQANPVIIHYTWIKPWFHECDHPLSHLFFKYLALTPWKGMPLKYFSKGTSKYKYILKRWLIENGVKKPTESPYIQIKE